MKPLDLRANGGKHQKLLLGNNTTGKCLQAHMQHLFNPRYSLSQHFFIQKSKTCHETVEFTSQWGENTKNYSWATMPEASAFTPTCNISSALAPLSRKNSLSQHFFIQKTKNLSWNRWIYEPLGAKKQKLLLGNNSPGKCLQAHMQHFFSPSRAIEKKFAESAFFSYKNQKLVMKPLNLRANWAKHQKLLWATIPLASAFRPTCNISSALAALSRKNSLSQHFFPTKIKNLSWNHWIYEPMGAKHQKLLLGNNAPGKCLHAHIQHFFSPSPAIEKKFAESAFFHTKIQKLVMKPLNLRANGGKTPKITPGQQFPWQLPSRPHATFLQPLPRYREKIRWVSIFSYKKTKICHETVEFTSQWGHNTKNYSWATMPLASAFSPHATFLQP